MSTTRADARPNTVLAAQRARRGWGQTRAAREMLRAGRAAGVPHLPAEEAIIRAIRRHENGRAAPDDMYTQLYCLTYQASPQDLFGEVEPVAPAAEQHGFAVRSHKFIPAYVGPAVAARLVDSLGLTPAPGQWLDCAASPIDSPSGACRIYAWPFGIVAFHLAEDLTPPNVAHLAVWRRTSYEQNLVWATRVLREITGTDVEAPYVLSLYWLLESGWIADELDTALRMLCMPRVLLERDDAWDGTGLPHAELVEQRLLRDGFEHPEMVEFGIRGIARAYASWSGVVYHPIAAERALPESDVVAAELSIQAIWAFCHHVRGRVEQGQDPDIDARFGWRWLRGARSRLLNPRPQETGQHRSMREAILNTSGLPDHLADAIDTIRDVERQSP